MNTKAAKARRDEPRVVKKPLQVVGRGLRAGRRGVALSLRTLREAAGKTQAQVEVETGINQGDVSRLETADVLDDYTVKTLRRYARALGGDVELVFVWGDRRVTIAPPPRRVD
jgi:hypothetical protein